MATEHYHLQLNVPAQTVDPRHILTQPDAARAWVMALPYTDLPECGQQLLQQLYRLARCPIDSTVKYKLLQFYKGAVDRYYPLVESELLRYESSSSVKFRQLALRTTALFANIFATLKAVLVQKITNPSFLERESLRIDLLLNTLHAARQLLNVSKLSYSEVSTGFWFDCHQLYRLAASRDWLDKTNANNETILDIYKHILALGITSTNRLSCQEMLAHRDIILTLAHFAEIRAVPRETQPQPRYLIELERDEPPRFLPIISNQHNEACLWLDLGPSIQLISNKLEQFSPGTALGQVEHALYNEINTLKAIWQEWTQPQRRRHPRMTTEEILELSASLVHVWYRLNHESWQLSSTIKAATHPASLVPPSLMHMQNQSEHGYLIHGHSRGQALKVGEVVLVTPLDRYSQTNHVCTIRWLKLDANGQDMECGLEILSDETEPVLCIPTITHPEDLPQFALLLKRPHLGQTALLLIGGRPFTRLREFRLQQSGEEQLIRVTKLITQTPHYQLMEFKNSDQF